MFEHPSTIVTTCNLHRKELLAIAAREHQAAGVSGPALSWPPLAILVLALVVLSLGLRG